MAGSKTKVMRYPHCVTPANQKTSNTGVGAVWREKYAPPGHPFSCFTFTTRGLCLSYLSGRFTFPSLAVGPLCWHLDPLELFNAAPVCLCVSVVLWAACQLGDKPIVGRFLIFLTYWKGGPHSRRMNSDKSRGMNYDNEWESSAFPYPPLSGKSYVCTLPSYLEQVRNPFFYLLWLKAVAGKCSNPSTSAFV